MPPASEPRISEAGDAMCREAASDCRTCLLSFSRGKDSIAAWLLLRKYFDRVVPFTMIAAPHLGFVDESLAYYEEYFETKILRYMNGDTQGGVANLELQPPWEAARVEASGVWPGNYSYEHLFAMLRDKLRLPDAWGVTGRRLVDSSYVSQKLKRHGGIYRDELIINPVFDWDDAKVLRLIRSRGLKLPEDYRMSYNSLHDMPTCRHLYYIRDRRPADFARIKEMFPLIEAHLARNEFRKMHRGLRPDPKVVDSTKAANSPKVVG